MPACQEEGVFVDYQERRQIKGEATRMAILDAATQLARQEGFARITVRDICKAAGVTTGAFYHHFLSKDDLLTQGFASLDAYMEKALAPYLESPPVVRLQALLRLYARFIEELGWQTISLYYSRRLTDPQAASMSPNRYTLRAMEDCLADLRKENSIPANLDASWTADFFFRHFRGTVVDWALHRGSYPLWEKLEPDYQLFARALQV